MGYFIFRKYSLWLKFNIIINIINELIFMDFL